MQCTNRSEPKLVHAALDVKAWIARPPSVAAVRPSQCPRCGQASRPVGCGLGLWGHGRRERQVRGPLTVDGPPALVVVAARRYRCRGCGTIVLVVPRGLVARRLFSGPAIALACTLFGVERQPLPQVRAAVHPWTTVGVTAATSWRTLRRWLHAVRVGRLFPIVRLARDDRTARAIAARVARTLAALGPPGVAGDLRAQVFAGAGHAS
jgi:DNA-directed RNA polymerase subunit RPC12/RpoP